MKIKLDPGAYMPERAHATDAGLDIKSPKDCIIPAHDRITIRTGVHIKLPMNTVGKIASRSGLMTRFGILTDGTIDEGYNGEICVCLFNQSNTPYFVANGDKIAQLIIQPCIYVMVEQVDDLQQFSERGDKGFGSTGR